MGLKIYSPKDWKNKKVKTTRNLIKNLTSKIKKKGLWSSVLMLAILCIIFFGIILLGVFAWFSKDLPDPDRLLGRDVVLSTKIYDKKGETVLYDIHGTEKRTFIELNQVPDCMKWSVILLEDKDFYKHSGIKFTSIIRAVLANIFGSWKSQGGSTITQQFVKNAILTPEKTITRKIKEIILSIQLERKFTKDQILQMYFNEIPWGSTAYGVEAAAQTYFGKPAKDLTTAQSALLAAMVQRPTYYSPTGSHIEELLWRKDHVLDLLYENKYIDDTGLNQAKSEDALADIKPRIESITAPHFVMFVKELLTEKYGEKAVEQGGLKVITTLDLDMQQKAEEAIAGGMERVNQYGGSNAALTALDPKTGQILAMVGSKDFFDEEIDGQVNVTIRPRQPGSSFKPIVYSAAFLKGYTPETILYDVVTNFNAGGANDYIPHNYDLREHGPVTIKKALAGSLNIPAVKAIYLAGINNVIKLAQSMGYTTLTDPDRYGLSLVLGGGEVKLLEHINAFGIFAREGEFHPYTAILKIEDRDGNILEEYKDNNNAEKALDAEVCRKINDILSDNSARAYIFGSNNYLNLGNRPVAAKTGTTNDYRDAWTIGYTPSIVAGVWTGNNDNSEMKRGADGSVIAAPIWNKFMSSVLTGTPIEYFKEPAPNDANKPVLHGMSANEQTLKIDKASGKLATDLTPEGYVEEKTFSEIHCILYYIDKDNPRGDYPKDPGKDSQFASWEGAVQNWHQGQCDKLKEYEDKGETPPEVEEIKCVVTEKPPTEQDDVHVLENKPIIEFVNPQNNQTINESEILIQVKASAPRGIYKIEYIVDNELIATKESAPFDLLYALSSLDNGFHELKVIAFDDIDNQNETTINFNYLKDSGTTVSKNLIWLFPQSNSTLNSSSYPLSMKLSVSNPANVSKIEFYYKNVDTSYFINSIKNPSGSNIDVKWESVPPSGSYILYTKLYDSNNSITEDEGVIVNIE